MEALWLLPALVAGLLIWAFFAPMSFDFDDSEMKRHKKLVKALEKSAK